MRRVKNVGYDADEWGDDWEDYGGGGWAPQAKKAPKAKAAAAKPQPKAKPAAAPAKTASAATPVPGKAGPSAPKASAPAAAPAAAMSADAPTFSPKPRQSDGGSAEASYRAELEWLARLPSQARQDLVGDLPILVSKFFLRSATLSADGTAVEIAGPKDAVEAARQELVDGILQYYATLVPVAAPEQQDEESLLAAAPALGAKAEDTRPSISLVVVGHVDAGKSTLMGHLLCLVGSVSSKQLHKFEKESKQIGKASFAFAWVLDEGEDERQRGVTIDVCVKHFETKARRFTILDAPGHRDFVPNMLQGAVQADVALLVADVSHFEASFDRGGQAKEHLQLVRSLGISQLVVVVNKLDTCDWDEQVYQDIKGRLHGFITGAECGFKEANVKYIPLSGFSGENMLERKEEKLKAWWAGPTLVEALDELAPPARPPADGPLRMCISDMYRAGANSCLSGKVESGTIFSAQKVVLLPSNEQTMVKSLQSRGEATRAGRAGDYMDAVMLPVEPQFAAIGGVLCDTRNPVPVVDSLQAQILVFDIDIPMMRGQQFMCYLHTETLTATLTQLEKLVVKGKPQDRRPKCLQKGNSAIVQLQVSRKVCVEPRPAGGGAATSLSRLVLRDRGKTVAAGVVLGVL